MGELIERLIEPVGKVIAMFLLMFGLGLGLLLVIIDSIKERIRK